MTERCLEEAKKVAERVETLRREDSLVFPIFTDPHLHTTEEPSAVWLFAALEALGRTLRSDGVLALGDNLGMLGRERHAGTDEISALIREILDRAASAQTCPLYPVNGNHDGIGTDFFDAELWYSISGERYDACTARREGHSAYYFVDFPRSRVRMIVLSLPSGSDLNGEHPTPDWKYGDAQLRWLANTALDTAYSVLLVGHVPLFYTCSERVQGSLHVFDGEKGCETSIRALCGWIEDRPTARAIFEAFAEHRAFTDAEKGIRLKASAPEASLLCCLSGHNHGDELWRPFETREATSMEDTAVWTNPLPCVQAVTASCAAGVNKSIRADAELPTALDVAVITPSERKVTLVRFGVGEDRSFSC